MTDQSPEPSHEQARDLETQQPEHDAAPTSSEPVPPTNNDASDDGAHSSESESISKEGDVSAKDVTPPGSNDGKASQDGDQDKEGGEEDDNDEDDDNDEEDDDDEDEDDEEDEDEEEEDEEDEEDDDEEPKLKYARLTQHLNGVYRNGDATSAFLVAGDKMVGSISASIQHCTDFKIDCWNA